MNDYNMPFTPPYQNEHLYCSVRKKFGLSFFIDVCSYVYDQDFALAPIQNKDN